MGNFLQKMHVEGVDDISVINALLFRHGIDTHKGAQHLHILAHQSVEKLLAIMPDVIRAATDQPVGFVLDIDVEIENRWNAVCGKLNQIGITPPANCPTTGYFGKISDYPCNFGIWLMPDCTTDNLKLENLCESLIPSNDPLWPFATRSVSEAATIVDEANANTDEGSKRWERFREIDQIKAEIHTWLAWQREPGYQLGAAVNAHILGHDSPQTIGFLRWVRNLYGFLQLAYI